MKSTAELPDSKRAYRQTARAAATEATAERVVAAFRARLEKLWFDEIRLDDVARDAGVTVQTVIRRFGGKEGLLDATVDAVAQEVLANRRTTPGDAKGAVRVLIEDYELSGDLVIRVLAQENRYPVLQRVTSVGRREHREWIQATFAPWLAGLDPDNARQRTDALVAATDLYIWQIIRRDMGRPVSELREVMDRQVQAVLSDLSPTPIPPPQDSPR